MPNKFTMFVCSKSSVATKNGNKDGTTEVAHKIRLYFTAVKLFLENNKSENAKIRKTNAKKFLFNLITKKLNFGITNFIPFLLCLRA